MTDDDPMREATLALLVVVGREGWGPQPWSFVGLVSTTEPARASRSGHLRLTDDDNPLLYLTSEFIDFAAERLVTKLPDRDSATAVAAKSPSPPRTYRARSPAPPAPVGPSRPRRWRVKLGKPLFSREDTVCPRQSLILK